ncbi:carboxyvinyl-carboxyphosphonate phosphorylmutase [Vibrio alginolyticus]|nr:carboxyvinyl-carboxyphosphonate phosphorylmutase [Vibrio alginolyticus]
MQQFKQLHQQATPLLLANVWDAASANCALKAGYQALGTSSAAIASMLGYEDGEKMSFSELAFIIQRIAASSLLPLSVDIEAGFSQDPEVIADHIQQLTELGAVGINIEDSRVETTRTLVVANEFAALLSDVRAKLQKRQIEVFINVRCDAFLLDLDNAREEAIKRAKCYQQAGADGLFFPCITAIDDIKAVVASTTLPINVMSMPELPNVETLKNIGVKRISTGNFAHDSIYTRLGHLLVDIKQTGSCAPLFE